VLIDECLPVQMRLLFPGHDVRTVQFMGWKSFRNGELLAAAAGQFDVLITSDAELGRRAQNTALGIVVIPTNKRRQIELMAAEILTALENSAPGLSIFVPRR
jgi:hypothetical protein